MIARLLVALLALLFPPLMLIRRRDALAWIIVSGWLAGVLVFFLLAWGPGLAMAGLAGLLGLGGVLLQSERKAIP